jgi:hypothetical protein
LTKTQRAEGRNVENHLREPKCENGANEIRKYTRNMMEHRLEETDR